MTTEVETREEDTGSKGDCWEFDFRKGWTEISDPLRTIGGDDERVDQGELMERANYREIDNVAEILVVLFTRNLPGPESYRGTISERYPFFIEYTPNGSHVYSIYCPDLPSMIEAMGKLSTGQPSWKFVPGELLDFLEKAFRVFHGHPLYECCPSCDPVEYEAKQRRRREWAERKAKKESERAKKKKKKTGKKSEKR